MRRCVSCGKSVEERWDCASCGFEPELRHGLLCFAPESAVDGNGFEPAAFALLADVEEDSFWFQGRSRLILWALNRYFAEARSLLEIGCGTGYVLAGISQERPEMSIAGADLYVEGLAHARRRLPDTSLYQLDATRIPFDREWDVLAAFDVLEHVRDDEAFLAGMYTAARPGGGLMITVPQHPGLWSAADEFAHHVRRYRRVELLAKVRRAGFVVERVTSFVSFLLPAMWVSRVRDRRQLREYDPAREHAANWAGPLLRGLLEIERACIARGMDFPVGGSLMVVARRP